MFGTEQQSVCFSRDWEEIKIPKVFLYWRTAWWISASSAHFVSELFLAIPAFDFSAVAVHQLQIVMFWDAVLINTGVKSGHLSYCSLNVSLKKSGQSPLISSERENRRSAVSGKLKEELFCQQQTWLSLSLYLYLILMFDLNLN